MITNNKEGSSHFERTLMRKINFFSNKSYAKVWSQKKKSVVLIARSLTGGNWLLSAQFLSKIVLKIEDFACAHCAFVFKEYKKSYKKGRMKYDLQS